MAEFQPIEGHGPVDSFGYKTFIYRSKWGFAVAEKLRQALLALSWKRFELGGSRENAMEGAGVYDAWNYRDFEPPYVNFYSHQFVAEMRTENAGTGVRAILRDETDDVTLFTSAYVTATTWDRSQTYTIPTEELIANHAYRVQFETNGAARAYGVAWINRL